MARVPNGAFPKVGATPDAAPYSRVNPTAAAFGALQGQAQQSFGKELAGLGETGMKIITDINKENIQRNARYADNEYSNIVRSEMYGDGTEQNPGFLNLKGQAAIDARAGVVQRLADARVRIGENLTNPLEQDLFTNSANERDDVVLKNAMLHTSQQRELANETALNVSIDTAMQDGALGSADPETVHQNEIRVQQAAISQANAKGLDEKTTLDYAKGKVSKYYEAVITNRMETNTDAAKEMLTKYGDRIGGLENSVLTKRLEAKERDDLSRKWAVEDHAHTQRLRYQNENFAKMVSDIQFKGAGLLDIQRALDAGKIDGAQAENLVAHYTQKQKGGPGDEHRANELDYMVRTGRASWAEVMTDKQVNEDQRSKLIATLGTVINNGGVLANQSVQDGQKVIDALVAAKTSPLDVLDFERAARLTVATTEYQRQVLAIPAEQLTPAHVDALARSVAASYVPPKLQDPPTMIDNVLPRSPYWTYKGSADKTINKLNLDQAFIRLSMDKRKIPPQEFALQGRILSMYRDTINAMTDRPAVVLNKTN